MKPLVAVFAHPDDEAFGPGGALIKFSKERDVFLICVTDGNAQEEFNRYGGDLCSIRKKELLESTRILGVKDVTFLEYKDGALCNNNYHKIARSIEEVVKKYDPESLLTFEPRGVSGHIDHVTVSLITSYIFQKNDSIRELYYFCEEKEAIKQFSLKYFICMPPGFTRDTVDLVIDIHDVWNTKKQAIQTHASQKHDVDLVLGVKEYLPKEEFFCVLKK